MKLPNVTATNHRIKPEKHAKERKETYERRRCPSKRHFPPSLRFRRPLKYASTKEWWGSREVEVNPNIPHLSPGPSRNWWMVSGREGREDAGSEERTWDHQTPRIGRLPRQKYVDI